MKKVIFTAASPNTQIDDVFVALKTLFTPWSWGSKKSITKFETELKRYLNVESVNTVDSGRSALMQTLLTLKEISGEKNEIIMPSFTCVVVPNAVAWAGFKPIYLDTNSSDTNADYNLIKNLINENTAAIIAQHTFGKRIDIDLIKNILKELDREDIKIIEDFAHLIQSPINLKGDFGFMTFGIEKVFSAVRGGAVITNNSSYAKLIEDRINALPGFPARKTISCLLNPIFWSIALPLHSVRIGRFSIGAAMRSVWRKMGLLGILVEKSENFAIKPDWFPAKMSGALSHLGLNQLRKLDKYNSHRTKIANIYYNHLAEFTDDTAFNENRVYLRFPIILKDKSFYNKVWSDARKNGIILGNWFSIPLYGGLVNDETYKKLSFDKNNFPKTVSLCERVLNLPTSINVSEKRAEDLAVLLKQVL